ncbi:Arachidonate 12-lipoxygenase, 12S-type [Nymphon striatum]|nr:Arachidonate 12-lipoxygenase, 12S-type [Nymphon striatum]
MLSLSQEFQGIGWKNLPGSDETGKMSIDNLIDILTTTVYQATAGHAAINNNEYETYAFVPNFPLNLRTPIPKPWDPIDEKYIVESLPNKQLTFETTRYALLLSFDIGANLGYLEKQLLYSPKDQDIIKRFREELEILKAKKYGETQYPYPWLDVDSIRNSCQV